jgi:hypothetical protein
MNSAYDNFPDAVWAAVRRAQITRRGSACKVIQLPGQNLWLVVDEDFPGRKAQFKLKGYLGHEPEYLTARRKAGTAVRKWQELIYSKASTGDLSCLPAKDNIRAAILCLAVQKDDTAAITALCQAGVDVNSGNGRALRRAMRTHRRHAVLALLQAGASVQIAFQLGFTPQLYGSPESWFNLVEDLICIIADANLDEGLPVFRDLAKMAGDPACRSLIVRLATKYPSLLAQLL